MSMKPTKICFEQRYHDDSGVEFGVGLVNNEIVLRTRGGDECEFPVEQLQWLIDALQEISHTLDAAD
jgi:hypothetical protein